MGKQEGSLDGDTERGVCVSLSEPYILLCVSIDFRFLILRNFCSQEGKGIINKIFLVLVWENDQIPIPGLS